VIHTGTHGSMEWTPGKGTGMSESCYPDICMNSKPHFYIYNSDNPSEGLVAKRRSYATLIDHMQNLMTDVKLYGAYAELDGLLDEYMTASADPVRSEELRKSILEKAAEAKFTDIGMDENTPLKECVRLCHEQLSGLDNSQINKGLHVFGKMPSGEDLTEAVYSIVRYGEEHDSLRDTISGLAGYDLSVLYGNQGVIDEKTGKSFGELIKEIGEKAKIFTGSVLSGKSAGDSVRDAGLEPEDSIRELEKHRELILDIAGRISSSDEIGSLLNALDGGFTEPGPSGFITRGRYDILPTGRNFYSIDPYSVPTRTAWKTGMKMAEATIGKHLAETGKIPESIGFFWTMGELIATGGETMAELMYLIGARPVWEPDGRVHDFEIIQREELGRPRIDVAINVSCILRDNMLSSIDLMDRAIAAVAALDEEDNYVRLHTLRSISEGMSWQDASARLFGAPPGTYTSGVNLAVFAGAWKDDKDLADVFVKTKGHGYGGGRNGKPMFVQFAKVLSETDIVFDRTASDEGDVLSCSCHFSNIGGMASAARYLSGKDVKTYYGDTRDPRDLSVGTLAEEFRRVMRIRTLNPQWIEAMKEHGYKGANDISKRVVRLFGWQATTHEADDWLFDEAVNTFIKDGEMRRFFEENNPYAMEEMSRRLLEAYSRGLWNPGGDAL
ncbi:MAG: cobaltochelatase subunit CobN, partial [Candidatus Methanomethylophilaceae archaeon]|nr:cobaltochelatase subunit CobN [Candidatus Methanomethylophilaceae archaeon]